MQRGNTSNIIIPIILSTLHKFSSTVFGFLNFFILVRILSKFDLGIWSIFLFVIAAFELSKGSLLKNAHIRLIINSNEDVHSRIAGSSILVNSIFTIIFIFLLLLLGRTFSNWLNLGDQLYELLQYYIPGLLIMIFFSHYEAVQQSYQNFKNGFTANLIRQGIFFLCLFYHFAFNEIIALIDLVKYYTIGNALGTIVLFFLTKKNISYKLQYSYKIIREILGYGTYMLGGNIVSQVSSNLDQILLSRLLSADYIGYYGIASRVMYAVDIPMNGASEAMFPSFTKASTEKDKTQFNLYLEKAIGSLLALIIPICTVLYFSSETIVQILAGPDFLDATVILQLYMLISIINIFRHQSSNTLLSLGKSKLHFFITLNHFFATILFIYIGINYFDYLGPAYARLCIAIVSLLFWIYLMKKLTNISITNILKYLIDFYPTLSKKFIVKNSSKKR
jgi:O-antigen/teichoic acid export membrane protein